MLETVVGSRREHLRAWQHSPCGMGLVRAATQIIRRAEKAYAAAVSGLCRADSDCSFSPTDPLVGVSLARGVLQGVSAHVVCEPKLLQLTQTLELRRICGWRKQQNSVMSCGSDELRRGGIPITAQQRSLMNICPCTASLNTCGSKGGHTRSRGRVFSMHVWCRL